MNGKPCSDALNDAQEPMVDQVHFSLSPERWETFCAALDAPPKIIPRLSALLAKPSVFSDDAE